MKIKGVLIDLDGVMYNNEAIIPGAVETIKWLRDQCIPFLFVTNTTRMNTAAIARHMNGLGILNKTGEEVVQIHVDEYGNGYVGAFNRKGMGKTLQPGN